VNAIRWHPTIMRLLSTTMNRERLAAILLLTAAVLATRPATAQVRTWSDKSGSYKTEAEFVDETDGVVRLKKTDGRVVSLPLERLSPADQTFVRKQRAGTPEPSAAADPLAPSARLVTIELLTGAQVTGRITSKDDQSVTVEATVGDRKYTRKYPVDRIRAVVSGGQRVVLNEGSSGSSTPVSSGSAKPGSGAGSATKPGGSAKPGTTAGGARSSAEVERLIKDMGSSPPDWWDATPLNYPKTLDLSWPEKPEGAWNAQKNVGQYVWEVIQPNAGKWHEGIRFVHFLLDQHQGDRAKCDRVMHTLGRLYYLLLQDYARAAFWWRKAGVERGPNRGESVFLADCYWRLGSKQMALDYLNRMGRSPLPMTAIKQLADMGETRAALQLAETAARGGQADFAYLYAGDACRIDGQYEQAIRYYEKVVKIEPRGNEGEVKRIQRAHARARTNIEAIRIFDKLDLKRIPDGKYRGAAPAYGGELHVEATVQGGRIEAVQVVRHEEKQYYAAMTETPRKIIQKQGLRGVDATTSATITSEAIINATAKALGSGLK
jgi:uncharacterized protein with FMN-binding domain